MNSFRPVLLFLAALAALAPISAAIAQKSEQPWAMQLSGTALHFQETHASGRRWNQKNWGVGVQYDQTRASSSWVRGYSGGTLRDSFGSNGLYMGVSEMRTLATVGGVRFQAGGGLFGLWRTFSWSGKHELVAAPLPILHFEDVRTGLGLNILAAPRVDIGGRQMPGFVFYQLTKRF